MPSFVESMKRSFTEVEIDRAHENRIATETFLEAAESLTGMFDLLGSMAFQPVKSDMLGNIKKVRERFLAAPLESATLQDLVRNELKSGKHVATEGLLWLVRGLEFTAQALSQNLNSPKDELSVSFRNAYGTTLKPFHSFLIKPVFSAAMSACPYRKDFYMKVGGGKDEDKLEAEMRVWLSALEEQVKILKDFLARKENKW